MICKTYVQPKVLHPFICMCTSKIHLKGSPYYHVCLFGFAVKVMEWPFQHATLIPPVPIKPWAAPRRPLYRGQAFTVLACYLSFLALRLMQHVVFAQFLRTYFPWLTYFIKHWLHPPHLVLLCHVIFKIYRSSLFYKCSFL